MTGFADSINDARSRPDGADFDPLSLFQSGKAVQNALVTEESAPGQIPGVPGYALEYHAKRFLMGRQLESIDQNSKIFSDVDQSDELKEVMDLCLAGKAVILKRLETFLQDGSVVVWFEWGVYKETAPVPPEEREYFTEKELLAPDDPKIRALMLVRQAAEKLQKDVLAAAAPVPSSDAAEEAESVPEEPLWGEPSEGEGPDEGDDEDEI